MRTEDGSIIQRCLDGDASAFGILVDKYKAGIYAFAYDKLRNFQDAQDVTQEVFERAYINLRNLRRWESFAFWLHRIASNQCRRWFQARSRRPDSQFIADQDPKALDRAALDAYRDSQMDEPLWEALDSLSDTYREVLILHYFGGMTIKDMAIAIGVSPDAIGKRLSRARAQLREDMIAMMDTAFEEQRLQASFTFRTIEAIKRIKIRPMPRAAGLPWGLSLAAGIMVTVLSLDSHLPIFNLTSFSTSSPSPAEARVLETGEIPVDILAGSWMLAISGKQEDIAEAVLVAETRVASDEGRIVFFGRQGIWVMDADGGNEEQLTTGDDLTPAWSPDGQQIAFARYPDDDIYIMNADGSNVKQLTNGPEDDYNPAWSPNGKQIAFNREVWEQKDGKWERRSCAIYVMDADGSNVKRLTESPPFFEMPTWSPDGKKIAFNESFVEAKGPRVWVMDADGGNQKMLNDWGEDPVWSPDGRRIAFSSFRAGSSDIYVMNADGSDVKILTAPVRWSPSNEIAPRWSPDGESIAFCSDRDGNYEIYVMDADGSNVQRLTNTPLNEVSLDWTGFSYAVEPAGKLPTTWGETRTN